MAKKEIHEFLDDYGTQEMFNILFEVSDALFDERIDKNLNASSDDNHMVSAKTFSNAMAEILAGYNTPEERVNAMIQYFEKINLKVDTNSNKHLDTKMVTGKIETKVTDPNEDTLYLQRDNVFDRTWNMYVYTAEAIGGEHWICVGDTKTDLVGYCKKDQVDELKAYLGVNDNIEYVPLTSEYINQRVNIMFERYKP